MTAEIISAIYRGIHDTGPGVEVSEFILPNMTPTGVHVVASNYDLSVDGDGNGFAVGPKELVLTLLINGQTFTRIFPENTGADLDFQTIYNSGQVTAAIPLPPVYSGPTWPNMEPDQVAAYQAWLSAGGVGAPPDWVFVNRAIERQRAIDAAAALAVLATQPPEVRAMFDIGGEGYGSALTIVQTANPGAEFGAIAAQATTLQTAADTAGILPSAVVAQQPSAALVGTAIDVDALTPGGSIGGAGGEPQPEPTPANGNGARGKSGGALLLALALGAYLLKRRKAA